MFLSVISFAATAQMVTLRGSDAVTDTLTNAGTVYLTTPANALNGMTAGKYAIQLNITNVSGTTAGTVILESSNDGTNWSTHFKTTRGVDGVNCDSLTFSGATSHIYNIYPLATKFYAGTATTNISNSGRRLYFRLKFVGTGTQSSIVSAKLIPAI